ncbi:MAG: hypothetical protein UHI54_08175 [Bifidobacterium merycicum]|nr:hypothetical protein [Bifidobacterium merycicum]
MVHTVKRHIEVFGGEHHAVERHTFHSPRTLPNLAGLVQHDEFEMIGDGFHALSAVGSAVFLAGARLDSGKSRREEVARRVPYRFAMARSQVETHAASQLAVAAEGFLMHEHLLAERFEILSITTRVSMPVPVGTAHDAISLVNGYPSLIDGIGTRRPVNRMMVRATAGSSRGSLHLPHGLSRPVPAAPAPPA